MMDLPKVELFEWDGDDTVKKTAWICLTFRKMSGHTMDIHDNQTS